jgi:ParB-like chromosome segregation protein Spo0J
MKQYKQVTRSVDDLIPYVNNSRTHSDEQISQVASSIKEFGFTNPILIDDNNGIIAGHGRLLASQKLKLEEVPCIVLDGLSEAQRKAYVIADNKLALNAGWDVDLLKIELQEIDDSDIDVLLTGFDALPDVGDDIDYSLLDEEDDEDVKDGVRKSIMIDFDLEHYDEAYELVKWWRAEGAYVGYMVMDHLRKEKEKHESN